jgi:hypothetical protein
LEGGHIPVAHQQFKQKCIYYETYITIRTRKPAIIRGY